MPLQDSPERNDAEVRQVINEVGKYFDRIYGDIRGEIKKSKARGKKILFKGVWTVGNLLRFGGIDAEAEILQLEKGAVLKQEVVRGLDHIREIVFAPMITYVEGIERGDLSKVKADRAVSGLFFLALWTASCDFTRAVRTRGGLADYLGTQSSNFQVAILLEFLKFHQVEVLVQQILHWVDHAVGEKSIRPLDLLSEEKCFGILTAPLKSQKRCGVLLPPGKRIVGATRWATRNRRSIAGGTGRPKRFAVPYFLGRLKKEFPKTYRGIMKSTRSSKNGYWRIIRAIEKNPTMRYADVARILRPATSESAVYRAINALIELAKELKLIAKGNL